LPLKATKYVRPLLHGTLSFIIGISSVLTGI